MKLIAVQQTLAVARKDFQSELRTRYALNSLGMFVVVTVAVMAFQPVSNNFPQPLPLD